MIRKLLASTAMLALMTAGSFSIAQAQDTPAQTEEPAVIEQEQDATEAQDATAEPTAEPTTETATSEEKLTPEEPTLATAFIGRSVFSSEDPESDNIGEVNDLIVSDDGSITHAVVGVGGFLGIGEKDVAVPFDELQVVEQEGDIRLVYAATKEQLEAAEEFDRTAYDPGERFAEEQAAMAPAADATAPADDVAAGTDPAAAPVDQEMAADTEADATAEPDTATADAGADAAADATAEQDVAAADAGTDAAADATAEPDTATADAGADAAADATAEQDVAAADADTDAAADATAEPDAATADAGADATAEQDVAAAGTEATTTADGETFISFNADQIRASTLLGQEVFGAEDESIGEISDLVLQEDGDTRAAIIDVGGFLGAGEKSVAIPFDQIEVQKQESGDPRLTIAMTREELEQAPAFEDATMGSEQDMAATDQSGTAGVEPDPAADATTEPAPEQDVAADATQPADGEDVIAGAESEGAGYELATQDLSAEELIGSAVYGSNDENLGEVGDVVFADSGEIEAVVVDVGGFLGVGEKPVAVQFDALNVQKDTSGDVQLMINASQEQLEGAPAYQEEQPAVQ